MRVHSEHVCERENSPKNKHSVIIYSLPCQSKHVWLTFFCETQIRKFVESVGVNSKLIWGAFPKNNYGRKFRRYQ